MKMEVPYTLKVLEQSQVSPPSGSVPRTSLPLTMFDIPWLIFSPVQNIFFYKFPYSTIHFMNTILPNLKQSLSVTLQHFYPLAGNLTWLPQSNKPEILYVDGDSIKFTVAESDYDFSSICGYHGRNTNEFYPLLPQLEPTSKTVLPLLALQVTIFPNSGICIGITLNHVVADGKSFNHFLKSWTSVCRLGGKDTSLILESLPVCDRTMIMDPKEFTISALKDMEMINISRQSLIPPTKLFTDPVDKVLATFVMGQSEIDRLKKWARERIIEMNKQTTEPPPNFSSFVVTCAYAWVCLIKALGPNIDKPREHFICSVDYRMHVEPPLPQTYFGNCVEVCPTTIDTIDLTDEDGVAVAAEVITKGIKTVMIMESSAGSDMKMADLFKMASERIISVAGSPILRLYDTDFGWGRPTKVDIVSICDTGAISLSEQRDGEAGLEVGLSLKKEEMEAFASLFSECIKGLPQ
ncbi:hypothetical protein GIB67_030323 [Kingdonia uniflora]|uniref:Uncharacterized protein n=1 Tax=Kingdonia uniflora TaxID=39325 RepID=A0A7J7M6P6_9MAGN|nr:hypothetical protein GIB67_030323 [Kingdonia uniflora]